MDDRRLHRGLIDQQGSRAALNTPVLVIDADALDANIAAMAQFAHEHGLALRPHAKTHKSAAIARRQMAQGALGVCCAKIGEAEALAEQGITGLHITSPVVTAPAITRLVALNTRTHGLMCVIDNPDNARAIAAEITAQSAPPLTVVIDIDPGIHRTGVARAEDAVALFTVIAALPQLRYAGVQFYCGMQQHIESFAERAAAMEDRGRYLRSVITALTEAGGAPAIVTGGGTGTHRIDAALGLFTELQVGSYVFMDDQYRACDLVGAQAATAAQPAPPTPPSPFASALVVDASVISTNATGLVTVDAGFKAFSTDADPPKLVSGAPEGSGYIFMGDEHGAILLTPGERPQLGDRVVLSVPHCDPTVNLYDYYHVVRDGTLIDIWPVDGRGRSR